MEARSSVQQAINSGYFYGRPNNGVDPEGSSARSASTPSSAAGQAEQDTVTLSPEGKEQSSSPDFSRSETVSDSVKGEDVQLDRQEIEQLQKLKRRDQEVRTHEQAHLSAAGRYARGGISLSYQKGPDGVAYAVGGEVGIDLGEEPTPEATLLKMQTIKRAALAPANPSGADRQIAARATAKETQARQEILRETQEEVLQAVSEKPLEGDSATPSTAGAEAQIKPTSYASLKSAITAYKRMAGS